MRDEKAPQILCDAAAPMDLEGGMPQQFAQGGSGQAAEIVPGGTLFLRLPSAEGKAFRHVQLALQMFPGASPVKIRLMDTGKLLGTACLLHRALVEELRTYLGEENVVLR